jgi:hypothetical protein
MILCEILFEMLMRRYRVYTLDVADRISASYDMECFGDEETIQKAQQIVHGSDIELWEKGRFIARFNVAEDTHSYLDFDAA